MDIQTISIVVAAAGVFIAAINSIISSRRAEEQRQLTFETQQQALETRQAQLFMQLYNRWNAQDLSIAYGAVRYKDPGGTFDRVIHDLAIRNPELDLQQYSNYHMLQVYFEGLGLLVKNKLIDIHIVEDLFAGRIIWYWETMQAQLNQLRKNLKDPDLYDSIEYLYNVMKQRQEATVTT